METFLDMQDWRIIPARAGFTYRITPTNHRSKDHPRSRGVYRFHSLKIAYGNGSSPLARGLPMKAAWVIVVIRIIPARAGFTSMVLSSLGPAPDHPRSRGVYYEDMRTKLQVEGSSPLARGLPRIASRKAPWIGIIPARAGFTLADPWNPNDE